MLNTIRTHTVLQSFISSVYWYWFATAAAASLDTCCLLLRVLIIITLTAIAAIANKPMLGYINTLTFSMYMLACSCNAISNNISVVAVDVIVI